MLALLQRISVGDNHFKSCPLEVTVETHIWLWWRSPPPQGLLPKIEKQVCVVRRNVFGSSLAWLCTTGHVSVAIYIVKLCYIYNSSLSKELFGFYVWLLKTEICIQFHTPLFFTVYYCCFLKWGTVLFPGGLSRRKCVTFYTVLYWVSLRLSIAGCSTYTCLWPDVNLQIKEMGNIHLAHIHADFCTNK